MNTGQIYTLNNEGKRYQTYDDATGEIVHVGDECKGTLTIGIGHVGFDYKPGDIWTEAHIQATFDADYHNAVEIAYSLLRGNTWNAIGEARQGAVIDMAFEMGRKGLADFHHMLAALRAGDYASAAREISNSKYAQQVPMRAWRNQQMLIDGVWR
jgi:lysozyme